MAYFHKKPHLVHHFPFLRWIILFKNTLNYESRAWNGKKAVKEANRTLEVFLECSYYTTANDEVILESEVSYSLHWVVLFSFELHLVPTRCTTYAISIVHSVLKSFWCFEVLFFSLKFSLLLWNCLWAFNANIYIFCDYQVRNSSRTSPQLRIAKPRVSSKL